MALAYNGLCTFKFGVAVEVFGLPRPEISDHWYHFAVAAIEPGPLTAIGGIRILADGGLELLAQAGTIIVLCWRGADQPVPEPLLTALRLASQRGARILSICSGIFVLAAAGLLTGRRATTHWRYSALLTARYLEISVVPDVLYIDEGQILTSAGSAAGIDLCLHLMRRDFGSAAANKVARRLVVPPHRDGGQAQFVKRAVPDSYESARLGPLLDRLRQELPRQTSIATLARAAGMSSRTFLRRFKEATSTTPARWLLAERLNKARDILEENSHRIETITELVGFASAASFRIYFRRQFSTTFGQYRASFGANRSA